MPLQLAPVLEEVLPVAAALGQAQAAEPAELVVQVAMLPLWGAAAVPAHKRHSRVRNTFLSKLDMPVAVVEVSGGAVPQPRVVVGAVL